MRWTMPRIRYQEELERLRQAALAEFEAVARQVELVLDALERTDTGLAADVVRGDQEVDRRYAELQHDLVSVIAREAPVATDLRLITALLHVSRMVERIGDQCVNIAKLIPVAGPPPAGAEDLQGCLLEMGRGALEQVRSAIAVLHAPDPQLLTELAAGDAAVNDLNRACFSRAIELGDDASRRAWATAMILVARAFERIGDNAVDVGAHLRFAATGTFEPVAAA
jgi:phosphate transport system protein